MTTVYERASKAKSSACRGQGQEGYGGGKDGGATLEKPQPTHGRQVLSVSADCCHGKLWALVWPDHLIFSRQSMCLDFDIKLPHSYNPDKGKEGWKPGFGQPVVNYWNVKDNTNLHVNSRKALKQGQFFDSYMWCGSKLYVCTNSTPDLVIVEIAWDGI